MSDSLTLSDSLSDEPVRVQMMDKIDKNHDFRLNFDEFVLLYEEVQRRVNCLRFARAKFKELDVNHSGTLDGDELLAVVDIMLELEAVAVEDKVTKEIFWNTRRYSVEDSLCMPYGLNYPYTLPTHSTYTHCQHTPSTPSNNIPYQSP